MKAKRLYEMGGDITADYFTKSASSLIGGGRNKKEMRKANRRMKKRGCYRDKCYMPNH